MFVEVAPNSTILILGTGLTMVDAAIGLSESGHRGPIVAVSRRGLLPRAHTRVEPAQIIQTELPSPARLASFLGWLRGRAREEFKGAEIGEASLMVSARTCKGSGAPCRTGSAEGFSNTRGPGGTSIDTAWRRRSKRRSDHLRPLAGCVNRHRLIY